MNTARPLFVLVLAAIAVMQRCSSSPVAGGTEAGNSKVLCVVYHPDGTPAANIPIYVHTAEYLPDTALGDRYLPTPEKRTDSQGGVRIDSLPPGDYTVMVADGDSLAHYFSFTIVSVDTTVLLEGELQPTALVSGRVDPLSMRTGVPAFVTVRGLDIITRVDSAGTFAIVGVPQSETLAFGVLFFLADGPETTLVRAGVSGTPTVLGEPIRSRAGWRADTLVVRAILDSNGVRSLSAAAVSDADSTGQFIAALRVIGLGLHYFPHGLGELTMLQRFECDSNRLDSLPEALMRLKGLTAVSARSIGLSVFPEVILTCTALVSLDLSGNQISEIPDRIRILGRLEVLGMAENRLQRLADALFDLSQLEVLSIRGNAIGSIPAEIERLTSLHNFSMGQNRVDSLPSTFCNLSELRELHAKDNLLTTLPDSIGKLRRLVTLELQRNQISLLPESAASLTNIGALSVDGNRLCHVSPLIGGWLDAKSPGWRSMQTCP